MKVIHKLDNFFYNLFPTVDKTDHEALIQAIQNFYTYGPYKPKVTIDSDLVTIDIDIPTIASHESDYNKVVALCQQRKFDIAKPILKNLITKNPSISEYHRILGQVLSDEGDQESAINSLIDALRWDSKNGWALLMMGNIFSKYKDDIPTAMKYYDQSLVANPNDNIAVNNIGANLMQQGKVSQAKKYFLEAIKINDKYPNTHFALGMIAEIEDDLELAFFETIEAIKLNSHKDVLYDNSVRQAFEVAQKIIAGDKGKKIFKEYKHKLEFKGDRRIDIVQDEEIPTAAKFEFAENYNRETHIVKYKPSYKAIEHLIMHELVHLDFVINARKENLNQLFTANHDHKTEFIKGLEQTIMKFHKMGLSENLIADYCSKLFEGMNSQVFNTPIDLFIENYLYTEFVDLRPYQFISLFTLIQEGLKAVTDKEIVDLSPKHIVSKSKVYNLVNAIQFKELYGFDFIRNFKATPSEMKLANGFYDEHVEYRDDRQPAEEYELVYHWAEDLGLDKFFELVNENEYFRKRKDIDSIIDDIEKDPYDLESKDPYKERQMDKFQKTQKQIGTNMAVVMYMVDALQFFESKPQNVIKQIAFEIATLGMQGFSPDKKNYKINSIGDKLFSGYHILAYYYVSWAIAIPEMISQLQLPYDSEYKLALAMHVPKKP